MKALTNLIFLMREIGAMLKDKFLNSAPITIVLVCSALVAYLVYGSGQFVMENGSFFDNYLYGLLNVIRHGDIEHLFISLALLTVVGMSVEPYISRSAFFTLLICSALLGTFVELYLRGPDFVGVSGLYYALGSYTVLGSVTKKIVPIWVLIFFVLVIAEYIYMRESISVFVHGMGIFVGVLFKCLEIYSGKKVRI